tara:strand:+ start:495 stop:875 length:381 start_codon:yes stop_codon:yes gene_type:complete
MIPWKTFKGRRKLNLSALVKDENLTTYEKLVGYLQLLHVAAPTLEEYNTAVGKNHAVKSSPTKKSPATRKTAPSKTTPKSEEDASEVWEAGLDGSYSDKKPAKTPAKRKTTTKRATRTSRTTKKKS